ncbi:peptidoglycan DD-metalloendopeptidase family protein [Sedimentibacter sp. zth1]|uniref:murein hydrolase activator EnvC family protein n=1 Tax=Sedimentibacter sp. zth1 TaxID=2816908 RepID=UPI001A911935|nr:peptidoglycan DD-metalloendopeptidase family protein [Sedimentibacter sp. zth1]QSX06134.1 peptidoglycan DD-metalloendopeptidase family protein [Sedimentibacter sp. zth1]
MRFKRAVSLALISVFVLLLFNPIDANASISSLEQQIRENNQKKQELEKQKKELKNEKNETLKEIRSLDIEIDGLNLEVEGLQLEIDDLSKKIEDNGASVIQLGKEIDANNIILEKRLRATYKQGGTGYLELILKSDSLSEALTRIDMIQLILKDDVELLKSIEVQKSNVTALKLQQEEERKEIETIKQNLLTKRNEISSAQNKKESYMVSLESNIKEMEAQEARLEQVNAKFEKQIQKLQLEMEYAGGEMSWPVPGHYRITSPFGGRRHPLYGYWSFHRGIDIACYYKTNVVAANSGVVMVAGWHYSYGNYVIIDHGGKISTVYGHNTKLLVKAGQKVTKGQVIALSGSTGESTGPHVHFEVRKNGAVVDPMPYVKK